MNFLASRVVRSSSRLRACQLRPTLARNVHDVRLPPYKIEDGLGDFLSPDALRGIAVDYQEGLLQRLNELVRGGWLRRASSRSG